MFAKVCLFAFLHVIRGSFALNPDFYVFNLETMNEVIVDMEEKEKTTRRDFWGLKNMSLF